MASESCTLFCRNGSAKYDPKTLQEMGCQKVDTPAGTVIQCPVSCSTMIHAVRAQGPAVKVSEPVSIAAYTHHGSHWLGYITYQAPDNAQIFANAKEIRHDEGRLFRLTKDRTHPGAHYPPSHMALPDVFTVVADETGPLYGRKYPFDGTVKYGAPYKLFTSWNFLPCPNTLVSRRQELDRLLPTTASVMCLYNGRNRGRDQHGKIECAYDNSRWVFVPADGATEEGETLCKDDMFYIAEYPGVGKSRFLKWNDEISNFDLVQKSEASVFSFPSSPVEQGPNHATCQYVPGNLVGGQPILPLQDDGAINIDVRDSRQGDQMIYQAGPGPMPPMPIPIISGGGCNGNGAGRRVSPLPPPPKPPQPYGMAHWLFLLVAALVGILVVMYVIRNRQGCQAGAAPAAVVPSTVRIVA